MLLLSKSKHQSTPTFWNTATDPTANFQKNYTELSQTNFMGIISQKEL